MPIRRFYFTIFEISINLHIKFNRFVVDTTMTVLGLIQSPQIIIIIILRSVLGQIKISRERQAHTRSLYVEDPIIINGLYNHSTGIGTVCMA